MIHVRRVEHNQVDKHWLGEAFMFGSARNNFKGTSELIYYPMYIVHKDNKDIGFFLLVNNGISKEITASYWPHPRYCRMNMLPIIQVATIALVDYAKTVGAEHAMLRIAEGLPCRSIKKMYDGFDTHRLKPGFNLMYGTIGSVKLNIPITYDKEDDINAFEVDI